MKFRGDLPHDIPLASGSNPEALLGVEFAYHIPYEWGVLQVSKAVHENSGLLPLVSVEDGMAPPLKIERKGSPKVRVSVVDFDTGQSNVARPSFVPERSAPIAIHGVANKGLLEVEVGIGSKDKIVEGFIEDAREQMRLQLDLPYAVDEDELPPVGEQGQSLREMLTQHFPQTYSHTMASTVLNTVMELDRNYLLMGADNNVVARNRRIGQASLVLGAVFAGVSLLVAHDPGIAVGATGANFYLAHRVSDDNLMQHFQSEEARQQAAHIGAFMVAKPVGDSIHETYCANHFAENILGHPDMPNEE